MPIFRAGGMYRLDLGAQYRMGTLPGSLSHIDAGTAVYPRQRRRKHCNCASHIWIISSAATFRPPATKRRVSSGSPCLVVPYRFGYKKSCFCHLGLSSSQSMVQLVWSWMITPSSVSNSLTPSPCAACSALFVIKDDQGSSRNCSHCDDSVSRQSTVSN